MANPDEAKMKRNNSLFRWQFLSIANQLRYGLVLFVLFSLLLTGGLLIFISYQVQVEQSVTVEQERSRAAASEINAYVDDLQRKLSYLARVPGLVEFSPEIQQDLLQGLLRHNNAYQTVAIFDSSGHRLTTASAEGVVVSLDEDIAGTPLFIRTFERSEDFIGNLETDPATRQPVVLMAVSIRDRQDKVAGVLVTRVNLNFLWIIISQVDVGQSGYAYIIDNRNIVIAKKGSNAETFNQEDISERPFLQNLLADTSENENLFYVGLNGVQVLGDNAPIPSAGWNVVIELPTSELYGPIRQTLAIMGAALGIAALLAMGLGTFLARQIVTPLQQLTKASARIRVGDMTSQVDINVHNEIGELATTFNEMVAQIRQLVEGLEHRTQQLEIIAAINERLAAILNLETLLAEVVNQVKDKLGYYNANIYLLDNNQETLVAAKSAGVAGGELKAKGPDIQLNAPANLVARAARMGEIVRVDNMREVQGWLPDPLLPNTHSEMAVPILLEGQVVGVLDVHSDKIADLDESDANLLRSLANQVAVAMHNVRLFNEVETALAEAYAAQSRYLEQAWVKNTDQSDIYRYQRPGSSPLSEAIMAPLEREAIQRGQLTIANIKEESGTTYPAVAVPIKLQNRVIGVIQLREASTAQQHPLNERQLALIKAVTEQVAQTAENLRLFEEIRERASREQTIREITEKIRATSSLDGLVKTAAEELGRCFSVEFAVVELGMDEVDEPVAAPANGSVKG